MKILFLTRRFWPEVGGVETHTGEVAKVLLAKGHSLIVIKEKSNKTYSQSWQSKSLSAKFSGKEKTPKIYEIPGLSEGWSKKFKIWRWLFANRSLLEDIDIVHCHDVFFWYLPFRLLYPKRPVFTTFHGYETRFPPAKKAVLVRRLSEVLSWGNICVGDFIKKWYGTKPDFVTYGATLHFGPQKAGFGTGNLSAKITSKLNGDISLSQRNLQDFSSSTPSVKNKKNPIKILFIGRLEEDTGIPYYLDVLQKLKDKGVAFQFEAVGEGSLKTVVQKWGVVHEFMDDLSMIIKDVRVYFSSSYLTILYLLSKKCVVFSMAQNELKYDYLSLAPFSQYITIERSGHSMADKIDEAIQNPAKYQKMAEKGSEFAQSQTWEKVAEIYLKLWQKKKHV